MTLVLLEEKLWLDGYRVIEIRYVVALHGYGGGRTFWTKASVLGVASRGHLAIMP
jgi:hypothetical protein